MTGYRRFFLLAFLSVGILLAGALAPRAQAQAPGVFTLQPPVLEWKPGQASYVRDAEHSCEITTGSAILKFRPTHALDAPGSPYYSSFDSRITWDFPPTLTPGIASTITIQGDGSITQQGQYSRSLGFELNGWVQYFDSVTYEAVEQSVESSFHGLYEKTPPFPEQGVTGSVSVSNEGVGMIKQVYSIAPKTSFEGTEIHLAIRLSVNSSDRCDAMVHLKYTRPAPSRTLDCPKAIQPAQPPAPVFPPNVYSTPKDLQSYALALPFRQSGIDRTKPYRETEALDRLSADGTVQLVFAWKTPSGSQSTICFSETLARTYGLSDDGKDAVLKSGGWYFRPLTEDERHLLNVNGDLMIVMRHRVLDELEKVVRDPRNSKVALGGGEELLFPSSIEFEMQVFLYDAAGKLVHKSDPRANTRFTYVVKYPVVFIPGTAGSRLTSNRREIWPQPVSSGSYGDTASWAAMRLDESGAGDQVDIDDVFRCYALCALGAVYQGWIDHMREKGYVELQSLLLAPYDWRIDIKKHPPTIDEVVDIALDLNYNRQADRSTTCIDMRASTSVGCLALMGGRPAFARRPDEKVVVVTHSQGGLVGRAYTADQARADKVAFMVQLAPTNYGSLKAMKAVGMTGYSFETPFLDAQVGKWMAKNYPAAYFQWPVTSSGEIDRVLFGQDGTTPVQDVRTELSNLRTFMFCDPPGGPLYSGTACVDSTMNAAVIDAAVAFHKNLPSPASRGVPTYVVAGTDQQTIIGYRLSLMQVQVTDSKLNNMYPAGVPPGDTIPVEALMATGSLPPEAIFQRVYRVIDHREIPIVDDWQYIVEVPYYAEVYAACGDNLVPLHRAVTLDGVKPIYVKGVTHGGMTEAPVVQGIIDRLLGGVRPLQEAQPACSSLPAGITQGTVVTAQNSPANLHIYDGQGRHTGLLADGSIETGIPGSSFEVRGGTQEAVLPPTGEELRIVFQGLVETRFDVRIRSGDGATEQTLEYLGIPESPGSRAEMVLDPASDQSPVALSVDSNGDGATDQTINPEPVSRVSGGAATAPTPHAVIPAGNETVPGPSIIGPVGSPATTGQQPDGGKTGGCRAGRGVDLGLVFIGLVVLVSMKPRKGAR